MVGALVFLVGLALRVVHYARGQWHPWSLIRGVGSTLFSAKIVRLIEIFLLDGILQRRLFSQDKSRWLMKVSIMIGYPGILIAGHLKVEVMPQFEGLPHLVRFFYAPFCDFYYFRDFTGPSVNLPDALFAFSFDLFGAMILLGEFIAIFRRFVIKASPFKTSTGDIIAVNLLGGWFILRFFCEAISILTYSIPGSMAQYWFVSFGLSRLLAPLALPWGSLNYPLWSLSGLFLAMLVAAIPFNKKLWHIITIPLMMFVRLMPDEAFAPGNRKASIPLSPRDLIGLDACVKCGSCLDVCPVYAVNQRIESTMGGLYGNFTSLIARRLGLHKNRPESREIARACSEDAYLCTLCGRCRVVCPAWIDTRDLRIATRTYMVSQRVHPEILGPFVDNLMKNRNITSQPNEDRAMWMEALGEPTERPYQTDKAKLVYFVGCVASYFPMAYKIPRSFVQILARAAVDFTILGGEEWCCGFPLMGAGMIDQAEELMAHNLKKIEEIGAEAVVFTCPSCYQMWKKRYTCDLTLFHATELIGTLLDQGKIEFQEFNSTVTYHDPCDLGRGSEVYDAPRKILKAVPGLKFVEMEHNREDCTCCGGGGNLEMVDPKLVTSIAKNKIEEIQRTGAGLVITSCQQCVRTMATYARKNKIPVKVMDITEFVLKTTKP
jgi:heterodisulfide reductase subunit D